MDVKDLQRGLHSLGHDLGAIDGVAGPRTLAAIKAFQAASGLVVDGIAGPQTIMALKAATEPAKLARPEPDKAAMAAAIPEAVAPGMDAAARPINADKLELRATARPISEIIVHCTATPEGKDYTVDDIRAWHRQRGWSDIGYHYVVYRDGRVLEGRPVGQVGSHVAGRNTGTISISYIGGLTADGKAAKDTRTAAQRASLLWLVTELRARHKSITKVTGHNQYAAKACPSFDVRKDALATAGTRKA